MKRKRGPASVDIGEVEEFEWDQENLDHCADHGFGPRIARQVKDDLPRAFPNERKRRAPFYMVGKAENGLLWTIAIEPTSTPKRVASDHWVPQH